MYKIVESIDTYLTKEDDLRKQEEEIKNRNEIINKTKQEQKTIINKTNVDEAESELEELIGDSKYVLSIMNVVYEKVSKKTFSRTNLKKEFGKKGWAEYKEFCKEIGIERQAKISYRLNIGNKTINYSQGKLITAGIGTTILTSSTSLLIQDVEAGKQSIESIKNVYAVVGPGIGGYITLLGLFKQNPKIEEHITEINKKVKQYKDNFYRIYKQ